MARLRLAALVYGFMIGSALAQGCGPTNPNCIVPTRPFGDNTNAAASTAFVQQNAGGGGASCVSFSGDVTGTNLCALTISAGAVTLAKQANLAANSIIGNNTGSAATPLALTGAQVAAMLPNFSTSTTTAGLVPGSNGASTSNFLRADGTWAIPAAGGMAIGGTVTGGTTGNILTVGTGPVLAQGTFASICTTFTSSNSGCVPTSPGGTTTFLRADGTWVAPGGSGAPGGANTNVQYNSSGAFAGSANLTWVSPTLTVGLAGTATGALALTGATSGTITIAGQAAAGTYNFNLPTSAGSANGPLLSGGGGSTAMAWGTRSGNTTVFGTTSGTLTSGDCAKFDANGNIIDNGSACASGGTPGSPSTSVQFNNSGAFGGNAAFTFVTGSNILTLGSAGTATFDMNGTINLATAASSLTLGLVETQSYSGTAGCAGSPCSFFGNTFTVSSDNVSLGTNANTNGGAWQFLHSYGGSSLTGARTSFDLISTFTAASSSSSANRQYVALGVVMQAKSTDNGTGTGSTTAKGSWSGMDIVAAAATGGAGGTGAINNIFGLTGLEVDSQVAAGSGIRYRVGIASMHNFNDGASAVSGGVDAGILLSSLASNASTAGWASGLEFGVPVSLFGTAIDAPVASTGILISAFGGWTVSGVIDVSNVNISGNLFNAQGFNINASGSITTGGFIHTSSVISPGVFAFASLPTCGGAVAPAGSYAMINNGGGTIAWGSAAAGGGSAIVTVACNGAAWVYF